MPWDAMCLTSSMSLTSSHRQKYTPLKRPSLFAEFAGTVEPGSSALATSETSSAITANS